MSARRIRTAAGGLVALAGATASFAVAAHTEASAVAVPAAAEAVVAFAPTHGCAGSPTVNVRVQAPVPDARAGAVDGWTATATPDGAGNTVLEWTGGLLPADEPGSFPVELLVPDVVGTLLAFPAVQRCASGEELAWIGTAPGDEYPAPQVLVLPAGSEPATTLEDVPADAPGRDLLVALLAEAAPDDDAGVAAGTTVAATVAATAVPPTAAPTSLAPDTTVVATTAVATTAPAGTVTTAVVTATSAAQDDGGGSAAGWIVGLVVAAVAIAAAGAAVVRRRGAGASGG